MIRSFFFLATFLVGHSITLFSQHYVDSLKRLLYEINDNIKRVDVLNELSFQVYDNNVDDGFTYASEAYEHSRLIKYPAGQKRSLILIGYRFAVRGDFQKALSYYRQASYVNSTVDELLAYSYTMAGNVYTSLANYDSARYFYFKSIEILEKNHSTDYLAFAFKNLARLYLIQWKNKEAEVYFSKAEKIYQERHNLNGLATIYFALSDVNKNLAQYELANNYLNKGCQLSRDEKDDFLIVLCNKSQGDFYYRSGDYLKSLEILFKALEILKSKENPQLLASLYNQLGEVYEELGQHDVALKYYFDALKIYEPIGVKYDLARLYSEVGWIYKNQLNFPHAEEYMQKSLKIRQEIQDDQGISHSYNVMGVLYFQEGKYDKAIELLEKSLTIRRKIGHNEGISACIFNIALVYEEQEKFDKALEYHFRALEIDEKIANNKQSLSISYNQIGQVHTKSGNFAEALKYLTKANDLSKETGSKILIMNNYLFFAEFYEAKGDYKNALDFHKRYATLNDSIYSDGNALKLAEMQALYQVEQKNQEIELLNQNKEIQNNQLQLQRSKINQQKVIIISGVIGLLLISVLAYKTFQYTSKIKRANDEILEQKEEIQAQSEELIEANQTIAQINKDLETKVEDRTSALRQAYKELDTFFYRSSHDFRRPLTTFLGLAEVAKITVKDSNALELFSKVKETASNLDKMLIKLQSISDVGAQQLVFKEVFVKEIIGNVCDSFGDELQTKDIKLSCSIALKESFFSYPAMFKIIIENLIENAISFSGVVDPFIKISAFLEDGQVVLEVEDNGHGIEEQYHDRIFDMYFRGSDRSKGNGLGLYIVKKAVDKLNGKMTFRSSFGNGSIFRVSLPSNHNHLEILY